MKRNGFTRRYFMRLVSATPLALMLGHFSEARAHTNPKDALRTLILAIGPWEEDRRLQANDFVKRFLTIRSASEPFLSQKEALMSLANRAPFQDQPLALQSLDLSGFSDAEKDLMNSLVTQIYGFFEVHYFHVAGMPDVGVCKGREWYTRPPSEW